MRRSLIATAVAFVSLAAPGCAHSPTKVLGAQVSRTSVAATTTLRGIVHDANGAPRSGATLELATADGRVMHTVSDGTGAFVFTGLSPGDATLVVNSEEAAVGGGNGVQIAPAARSSRRKLVLRTGENVVAADSGF